MIVPALIAILAAVVSATATYLAVRRKTSGNVGTSEASDLWAESQAMRRELRDEASELRREVATLRTEAVDLRATMTTLLNQISHLRDENGHLTEQVEQLSIRLGDPNRVRNQRHDDPHNGLTHDGPGDDLDSPPMAG